MATAYLFICCCKKKKNIKDTRNGENNTTVPNKSKTVRHITDKNSHQKHLNLAYILYICLKPQGRALSIKQPPKLCNLITTAYMFYTAGYCWLVVILKLNNLH